MADGKGGLGGVLDRCSLCGDIKDVPNCCLLFGDKGVIV